MGRTRRRLLFRTGRLSGAVVRPLTIASVALAAFAAVPALAGRERGDRQVETPIVVPNDNRVAAGMWSGDTLDLRLEVVTARWHPEGDSGTVVTAPAFAEEGRAPQIPGPLIRVRRGSVVRVRVHNTLGDSTLVLHGLHTRPAAVDDSIVLRPGERRTVQFFAGDPGTYLYRGRAGTIDYDRYEREQLAGAFVVDSMATPTPDRILVVNIWGEYADSGFFSNALAINGRSWPRTERIRAQVGDSVRWRVINASNREHPMHLHGFYFRVDARGSAATDTAYAPLSRRLVVTEYMEPRSTMSMTWVPGRPGNWLFHCHLAFHVIPESSRLVRAGAHASGSHDASEHMSGLVVGIEVQPPRGWREERRENVRALRLFVQEGGRRGRSPTAMGFVLQQGARAPAADSVEFPGSLLVLRQGEPTDITVMNRLREPTGVHWHGIELESWSDGVVGWSGRAGSVAPPIAAGGSFLARLTLPRAGTFIYHTHLNDLTQLTSGLYGAIVVLPPGRDFDPETDHVYIAGWDGPEDPPHQLVNGDSALAPATFRAGRTHRMRFVCIGAAFCGRFSLLRDGKVQEWRVVAKDGADLPAPQATVRPAVARLTVGETLDAEFTPASPGEYALVFGRIARPVMTQRIVVR